MTDAFFVWQLTHVREGTLGARTSPGANSLKTSMDRIGTSPFASQNGVAQTGVTQAAAGQVATVSTTVTTKIEPPPRPQVSPGRGCCSSCLIESCIPAGSHVLAFSAVAGLVVTYCRIAGTLHLALRGSLLMGMEG